MSKQVLTSEQTRKTAVLSFIVAWVTFATTLVLLSRPTNVGKNGDTWGSLAPHILPAYLIIVGIPSLLLLFLSMRKDKQGELFALFSMVAHAFLTILLVVLVVWWNI